MPYLAYVSKKQKPVLNFWAFGENTIVWENFMTILKFFDQNSIGKLKF